MKIKKLRDQKSWSQEHLASVSGLSLRTIQRVEAGNTASLETLKSLASVFEIDISILTEDITVIDKTTEAWKLVPWWVAWGVWGFRSRSTLKLLEKICVGLGAVGYVALFIDPQWSFPTIFWFTAYWVAACTRWLDDQNMF